MTGQTVCSLQVGGNNCSCTGIYLFIFSSTKEVMLFSLCFGWLVSTQKPLNGFPLNLDVGRVLASSDPIDFWCGSD